MYLATFADTQSALRMKLKFLISVSLVIVTAVGLNCNATSVSLRPVTSLDSWITKDFLGDLAEVIPLPAGITYLYLYILSSKFLLSGCLVTYVLGVASPNLAEPKAAIVG